LLSNVNYRHQWRSVKIEGGRKMIDETSFIRQVVEWSAAVIALLVGVVYKKHEADIVKIHRSLEALVPIKDYEAYQLRAEVQRTEMREVLEKIFDRLEHHSKDAQVKFDGLASTSTQQYLSLLTELNKKADK
jgi:hypothetical protein